MSNDTFREKAKKVWGDLVIKRNGQRARNQLREAKFRMWFKGFRNGDDLKNTKDAIFRMFFDGLVISGLLFYWIGFSWLYVVAFGAGWFFLETKGFSQIKQVLASITLVKVGK